jgi:DNA-binding SARP family transcriptional activator
MLTQSVQERASFARVEVLDHFRIVLRGRDIEVSESGARLVACLALGDRPRPRLSLASTLWADRNDTDAQASLRRALWRLNEAAPGLVERNGHRLVLADEVTVDAREVMTLAEDVANGRPPGQINSDVVRLLQGDLLPTWSDDWLDASRESMRQARLRTLETLARVALEADRLHLALMIALAAVEIDPLRESARRIVITAHLAEGNVVDALRHYKAYRELLWIEIGLRPSRHLQELLAEGCGPIARRGGKGRRSARAARR